MKSRVILVALCLFGTAASSQEPAAPKWRIIGQLEEACSCAPACPCWFGSKPTKSTCRGALVLFIRHGYYGEVTLDGLAIANYTRSPEGQSMMESFGKFDFSTDYVDERATPEQRQALAAITSVVLPSKNASPNFESKFAPITLATAGDNHIISIGKVARLTGHLLGGGLGGVPSITNPPGADPLHQRYEQGVTSAMFYSGSGQSWNWDGSNYMRSEFALDSDQYAKYSADLAAKMAAEKK